MSSMLNSIDEVMQAMQAQNYIAERGLATAIFLALKLKKPLFLEGEAGVGKTEVAKVLSAILGTRKYSRMKMQPYECGMTPIGDAQHRFSVKFYLVAMLFILFDVEAIFLIPWAVVYRDLLKKYGSFGFWEMIIYIAILLVGFFYIWKKGVLDWNQPEESEAPRG